MRVLNLGPTSLTRWASHFTRLTRQKKPPTFFSGLRPIGELVALYRLFSKALLLLCDHELDQVHGGQLFARRGRQAEEVILIQRHAVEK